MPQPQERLAALEAWCKALDAKFDDRHMENQSILREIRDETKKTNGRVTKLETWKSRIEGGWWVIALLAGVVGWLLHGKG
jgi:hypothetical protein